jgi:hypothetical protein
VGARTRSRPYHYNRQQQRNESEYRGHDRERRDEAAAATVRRGQRSLLAIRRRRRSDVDTGNTRLHDNRHRLTPTRHRPATGELDRHTRSRQADAVCAPGRRAWEVEARNLLHEGDDERGPFDSASRPGRRCLYERSCVREDADARRVDGARRHACDHGITDWVAHPDLRRLRVCLHSNWSGMRTSDSKPAGDDPEDEEPHAPRRSSTRRRAAQP